MNDAYKMLKEFAADGRLCVIRLENENVIGEFFVDEHAAYDYAVYTGYCFRSSICPKFIDEDNAIFSEGRKSGMTGYAAEVITATVDGDDLLVSFDEDTNTYHRVHEIVAFGKNCYDITSPCRNR